MKIAIQGIRGCFHEEAARHYFDHEYEVEESSSFEILAQKLHSDPEVEFAIMAIENSIAGSILQNYRILREYKFRIIGELYMAIHLQLMMKKDQTIDGITEIHSHPMAIYQSLEFLKQFPCIKIIESNDTALSAKLVSESKSKHIAAVASKTAAELYGLKISHQNIESSTSNYTRFIILQKSHKQVPVGDFNKATIYFTVKHESGSLLKCLQVIHQNFVNISKLQSYPVQGKLDRYYFYLDLEFDSNSQYESCIVELDQVTDELEVLGVYQKGEYKI